MYNTFHYTLRRTLPPWSFQENLKELAEAVVKWKLDEVLVKVDTEEFSHGQVNLQWLDGYLPMLAELKAMLDSHGVLFSINPWITLCHLDRGRKGEDSIAGFEGMVDIDGGVAVACACPLSEVWRNHTREVWRRYASLHPHSIWAEDDLRNIGHAPNVTFGCFCRHHLERFARKLNLSAVPTREEVKAALFSVGEPHPWRRQWLEMLGEIHVETLEWLTQAIWDVDPAIRMGLMTSGARTHTIEGRDWSKCRDAASAKGTKQYLVRPNFGIYGEVIPRDLYMSADQARLDHAMLPDGIALTEVENIPYSRTARSVTITGAELLLSALTGCHGAAMNLFDHLGNPMDAGDKYGAMMASLKPRLETIGAAIRAPGKDVGVNVAFHTDYAKLCHIDAESATSVPYCLHGCGYAAVKLLGVVGVPVIFDNSGEVTLLNGQMARAFTDEQLRKWLSGGLWLDSVAAQILIERGFGGFIGVDAMDAPTHPEKFRDAAAEEFLPSSAHPRFASLFAPCYGPNSAVSLLHPAKGAVRFSRAVDNCRNEIGCTGTLFENSLGGRVFVHAFTYEPFVGDMGFFGPMRLEALRNVMRFLDAKAAILRVEGDGVQPYALQRELADGSVLLGFMNCSNDAWEQVTLSADALKNHSTALVQCGNGWQPLGGYAPDGGVLKLERMVAPLDALLLWLK